MKICRNPLCSEVPRRPRRGLCPSCVSAFRLALDEIRKDAANRRDMLRAIGDEPGDAAADAYQVIVKECARRAR